MPAFATVAEARPWEVATHAGDHRRLRPWRRRTPSPRLLRVGVLGLTGLTLADWLRGRAFARSSTPDTSVILIWKGGGPSHIDLWDLKPEAPAEYRGEFRPIATNVAGIRIGEHLPFSARQMDKFAILRSVTHPDAGHESASHYLLAGYRPTNDIPAQEMPSYGSITARVRRSPSPRAAALRRGAEPAAELVGGVSGSCLQPVRRRR